MSDLTYEQAIAALNKAWQEGYEAARHMAAMWGHTDEWRDAPQNPYVIDDDEDS